MGAFFYTVLALTVKPAPLSRSKTSFNRSIILFLTIFATDYNIIKAYSNCVPLQVIHNIFHETRKDNWGIFNTEGLSAKQPMTVENAVLWRCPLGIC